MINEARPTVGKLSADLLTKADPVNPIEQMRENLTDYERNIFECVDTHKKYFPGDFFVVVIAKKERLMQNVLRNYFLARLSCPTPDYDQTLYRYNRNDDVIEFIWSIPARDICFLLLENKERIPIEEYAILEQVINFSDGTYFRKARLFNHELDEGTR